MGGAPGGALYRTNIRYLAVARERPLLAGSAAGAGTGPARSGSEAANRGLEREPDRSQEVDPRSATPRSQPRYHNDPIRVAMSQHVRTLHDRTNGGDRSKPVVGAPNLL